MSDVIELAIRKTHPGQHDEFIIARNAFLSEWVKSEGVLADREFKSFYAFPETDDTDVYIGMTAWSDMSMYGAASQSFFGDKTSAHFKTAMTFISLFTPKTLLQMQVAEGDGFNLKSLAASEGQVLEVAVRKPNNQTGEEEFHTKRKAYVAELDSQPGVLKSYEFKVVSENPDGLTVGMTVYADQAAFQTVTQAMMSTKIAQEFFNAIVPVAVQYVVSINK